ncbi:MAG: 50S ribosomal protein L24 [Candidatus Pacearchaeota archaeon]
MKNKFSTVWKSSRKIKKHRKYRVNAPLHIKHKMLASHLSKELRKKYNKRAISLRKGDSIKVMRGEFRGKEGKVALVDTKKRKVFIEGIQKSRKDGTKVNVRFEPSKLMITALNLDDKKRVKSLERHIGIKTKGTEVGGK